MSDNYSLKLPPCIFFPKSDNVFFMEGLDLSFEKGSWLAFMGASGLGKTTLLRGLAGLLSPDHVQWKAPYEPFFLKKNFGFFSPNDQLLSWLSMGKNIALADLLRGKSFDEDVIKKLLLMMQLQDVPLHTSPHTLSSGMKQRILLARTLYTQPDFVFLDEPFGHMDATLKHALIIDMKRMFPTMSVVWVTHDASETSHAHMIFECTRCINNQKILRITEKRDAKQ